MSNTSSPASVRSHRRVFAPRPTNTIEQYFKRKSEVLQVDSTQLIQIIPTSRVTKRVISDESEVLQDKTQHIEINPTSLDTKHVISDVSKVLQVDSAQLFEIIPTSRLTKRIISDVIGEVDRQYELHAAKRPKKYVRIPKEQQLNVVKFFKDGHTYDETIRNFPGVELKRTTIQNWVKKYNTIQEKKKNIDQDQNVTQLIIEKEYTSPTKMGRPTLLDSDIQQKLLDKIESIRKSGGLLSPKIVVSLAKALLKAEGLEGDLIENGGYLDLTKTWGYSKL